jgi:hypothetical protein
MKTHKKKYRNEKWTVVSGDINNYKCFSDERFCIEFHAYTNELWNVEDDPFETIPQVYIFPEACDTLLEDFEDEIGGIKILLN